MKDSDLGKIYFARYQSLYRRLRIVQYLKERHDRQYSMLESAVVVPEQMVVSIMREKFMGFVEQTNALALLLEDEDHPDAIRIGNKYSANHARRINLLTKKIEKTKARLEWDMDRIYADYVAHLKILYLEISNYTNEYTIKRLEEGVKRIEDLDRAYSQIAEWHILTCKQYSCLQDKKLTFYRRVALLPRTPGIYVLFYKGLIIYIGRTNNLQERLGKHSVVQGYYGHPFIYDIECVVIEGENDAELEKEMIFTMRPIENIMSADR